MNQLLLPIAAIAAIWLLRKKAAPVNVTDIKTGVDQGRLNTSGTGISLTPQGPMNTGSTPTPPHPPAAPTPPASVPSRPASIPAAPPPVVSMTPSTGAFSGGSMPVSSGPTNWGSVNVHSIGNQAPAMGTLSGTRLHMRRQMKRLGRHMMQGYGYYNYLPGANRPGRTSKCNCQ